MPRWSEIVKSEKYQTLPVTKRMVAKRGFWDNVISNSPKYTSLTPQHQQRIRKDFFVNRPEEKIGLKDLFKSKQANIPLIKAYGLLKKLDAPVEKLAKVIEPKVPAGRTTLGLLTKDLPRQLTADVLRGYKPSVAVPFYAGAKAIAPVAKPIAKLTGKVIPAPVKKFFTKQFTVGKGAPPAYIKSAEKAVLEKSLGASEAAQVAKTLSVKPTGQPLSIPEQRYLGRIFRKETIISPKLQAHPKYKELKSISNAGRQVMDKWSKELVKSGVPNKEASQVIENNVGNYMARMYTSKLAKSGGVFSAKPLRLRLAGLKHRKNLTRDVLRQMGEIKEPALPTAIRVKELSTTVANQKLFKSVAQNPEWAANTNLTGNMIQMPNTATMGSLKGKWVIPEIGQDINSIFHVQSQAVKAYSKALGAWKYGKVVLNPATHARNMLSNSILLDLSGTNHIRQARLYPKAFKEYLGKGRFFQQALDDGAIGGEFVGGDVARIKDYYMGATGGNMQKWMNVLKTPFRKAGDIYQGEEQLAKLVKYMDVLEKGGTREFAAKEAQKWLFDYRKVPNFIKVAKHGIPFITFTYKSVPRIAEAITKNPMRVYKYHALFNAWNESSRKLLGMSEEEFKKTKGALPPWYMQSFGGTPMTLMMPWKDKQDNTQWLNLEYILPIGMAPELLREGPLKAGLNPFVTIVSDLRSNKDFRGKEIVPFGSTKEEATKLVTEYIYRQLAPSLAPGALGIKGGYSFEKIMDAAKRRPDYMGRVKSLPSTLLDTLAGIKVSPLDVSESNKFKMIKKKRGVEDLQSQLIKITMDKRISQEEKIKAKVNIMRKIQRIMKENK